MCPDDCYSAYNKQKLIRLTQFHPEDFSPIQLLKLETYIFDVRSNEEFVELKRLGDLAKKMVEIKNDKVYQLVYLLVTLVLVLPVATTTVEIVFFGMNNVKNHLRN